MKIALAQINPTVGDIEHNASLVLTACKQAHEQGVELLIFPELAITGYPPKDLLLRADFLAASLSALEKLAQLSPVAAIIGAPWLYHKASKPYNAAVLCHESQISLVGIKRLLPNYGVFDEERYFSSPESKSSDLLVFKNRKFLITICEDAWNTGVLSSPTYKFDPIALAINQHGPVDMIINLSASPYTQDKPRQRELIFSSIAKSYSTPLAICGQVGANDQLLFDGHSMYFNHHGELLARAQSCHSELIIIDTNKAPNQILLPYGSQAKLCVEVLSMGISDYVKKCGAPGVLIGLSGGIDSAVVAALAVKALGADKVHSFYLPSCFSSSESERDARLLASNLAIKMETIDIEPTVNSLRHSLRSHIDQSDSKHQDIIDQNLQARTRGVILMALANATDYLMLATANKSELAVGYSTLYGDLCGALAPLGDVYKTHVYKLANELKNIPSAMISKPPSAELKNHQKDSDTLPEYYILDQILTSFIEQELGSKDIAAKTSININLINQVISMINQSEYKRRQAPFSLMISEKVFGDGRRLPLAKSINYC